MDAPCDENCNPPSEETTATTISHRVRHNESMLEEGMQFHEETTTPQAMAMPRVIHSAERVLYPARDSSEEAANEQDSSETTCCSSDECSAEILTATVLSLPVAHLEHAVMISASTDKANKFDSPEWWAKHVWYVKATLTILIVSAICLSVSIIVILSPRACPGPAGLGINNIIGVYERNRVEPTLGYWSRAEVVYDVKDTFRWRLDNGVSWSMHWVNGTLRMGHDCPYGELDVGIQIICLGRDAVPEVQALTFHGGIFQRI